jgi:hypothetical protein
MRAFLFRHSPLKKSLDFFFLLAEGLDAGGKPEVDGVFDDVFERITEAGSELSSH